jgi:hypothetical protein
VGSLRVRLLASSSSNAWALRIARSIEASMASSVASAVVTGLRLRTRLLRRPSERLARLTTDECSSSQAGVCSGQLRALAPSAKHKRGGWPMLVGTGHLPAV